MVTVKSKGYPNTFNQWDSESDTFDVSLKKMTTSKVTIIMVLCWDVS